MSAARALVAWLTLVAVAQGADAVKPFQRPLSPAVLGGWTQVQLDADAQLHAETLWIGDEAGRPVPFLRESEAGAKDVALEVRDLVTGRDDAGLAVAEFTLVRADGRAVEQRESMRVIAPGALGVMLDTRKEMTISLEVDASGPWAADVEVAFDQFGQRWTNESVPRQIYDFGAEERRLDFKVKRIAPKWRVRLKSMRGEIRGVRAVTVRAEGLPGPLDARRSALGVAKHEDHWTLTLPTGPRRVLAVHLQLRGPVAPVRAELARLDDDPRRVEERATWLASGLVWELPGLASRAGEVRLAVPTVLERLRLTLPAGVEVAAAEADVAGESLWFVAEKGQRYFLHLAGAKQPAPGNLGALPPVLDGALPDFLMIGAPMDDPHGRPVEISLPERLRGWLPWLVGAAVAALAVVAVAMLRAPRRGA